MFQKSLIAAVVAAGLCVSSLAWAETVYVTKNGKKFHKAACELVKKSTLTELDEVNAKEQGYEPCKKCFKAEKTAEEQAAESGK